MQTNIWSLTGRSLALLFLGASFLGNASTNEKAIHFLGEFSNVRSTAEHSYGYSVELLQSGNELFGLFSSSDGLSGDTPTGQLEDVHFDSTKGSLSFSAKLSVAQLVGSGGKAQPTHDLFTFNGRLLNEKVLSGALSHKDMLVPGGAPIVQQVRLIKTNDPPPIEAGTVREWQQAIEPILKFRGPKW